MARSKLLKADVLSVNCPSRQILDHISSTWGSLILVVLLERTFRFSELRNKIEGISEKMLAQTLQTLEQDGFVLRKAYPVIPPKVEYSLTPMGKSVAKHMQELTLWIEKNLAQITESQKKSSKKTKQN